MKTKILLADDHTVVREGLRQVLQLQPDFEVVGEANSGLEALALVEETTPDLAILDISMKELNGIEATAQIVHRWRKTLVIILSMHSDERYVFRAMKAGARGYVLKQAAGDELVKAIRTAQRGEIFLSPPVAKLVRSTSSNDSEVPDRYDLLTERERHVYQMLAEGNSNKDVANRLGLSLHTVETHRARIMEKMDLHSSAELVLSAVRRGIVM
jgi:two-component system response regulator NreC